MPWIEAKKKHREALKEFALIREWEHVTFSNKLKEYLKDQKIFFFSHDLSLQPSFKKLFTKKLQGESNISTEHKTNYNISNSLMLTRFGILLPILFEKNREILAGLKNYIPIFKNKMFSVIGTKEDVQFISSLLPEQPHTVVDYYLMLLCSENFNNGESIQREYGEIGKFNLKIKLAHPRDAKYLFPLQRDYELEEVILKRSNYNPKFSFAMFKKNLEENIVLYAEMDTIPVAKAGTNARGFITDQIGGVFTRRDQRGKGIARIVMKYLLSLIFEEKKYASLFVKKHNLPAINLYKSLGFEIVNDFRIAYF